MWASTPGHSLSRMGAILKTRILQLPHFSVNPVNPSDIGTIILIFQTAWFTGANRATTDSVGYSELTP
jgi:hypothetical protein